MYKGLIRPNLEYIQGNQKVKSIIVTEITVRSPFITYSSQNPWNFLDMAVIMIKDDKCLSPFQFKKKTKLQKGPFRLVTVSAQAG